MLNTIKNTQYEDFIFNHLKERRANKVHNYFALIAGECTPKEYFAFTYGGEVEEFTYTNGKTSVSFYVIRRELVDEYRRDYLEFKIYCLDPKRPGVIQKDIIYDDLTCTNEDYFDSFKNKPHYPSLIRYYADICYNDKKHSIIALNR